MPPGPSITSKNPITIRPLHLFTKGFDAKKKTSVVQEGAAK